MSGSDMAPRLITPGYLELQKDMFARTGDYGRSGDKWLWPVLDLIKRYQVKTVLDYGCGRGSLVYSLLAADIDARGYDPAIEGKDQSPEPADLVVCTDVMEHIEPQCLSNVIDHLHYLTNVLLFVAISTRAAGKRLRDGRNAHLIIANGTWWFQQMAYRFNIFKVRTSPDQEWVAELIPHGEIDDFPSPRLPRTR
jgi:methyltransferase family protein